MLSCLDSSLLVPHPCRHYMGVGVDVGAVYDFGLLILGTLTKIDVENLDNFNDLCNQYKS